MQIIFSTAEIKDGISLYWDDQELTVEHYERKQKHYFCGKELLRFSGERSKLYTLITIDFDESYCVDVYSDGEIKKVFQMHSEIPKKHRCGGQSAARFSRIRDNEIVLWYKRLNKALMDVEGPLSVSINFVYKKQFESYLHNYVKEKICRYDKNEYSGLTGIYQYINMLEGEKNN